VLSDEIHESNDWATLAPPPCQPIQHPMGRSLKRSRMMANLSILPYHEVTRASRATDNQLKCEYPRRTMSMSSTTKAQLRTTMYPRNESSTREAHLRTHDERIARRDLADRIDPSSCNTFRQGDERNSSYPRSAKAEYTTRARAKLTGKVRAALVGYNWDCRRLRHIGSDLSALTTRRVAKLAIVLLGGTAQSPRTMNITTRHVN